MSKLKKLITEIHHRSLWQVLLIYVGAAWACFELIDTVTERLGLPVWLPGLAIVLFLLALPVVVATAFIKDSEPPATVSDPTLIPVGETGFEAARKGRALTWRNAGLSFITVLALWGIVATGWMLFGERATSEEVDARKSIAVLPFANRSADPENEYFSDGITDDIITHLSQIADLSVTSRTSTMRYKETEKSLREIAEELGVATILEGGVQRAGNSVRINVQLIDAETDAHLWAETYNRTLEDVFAIQSDVARRVANALRSTLTSTEEERIDKKPTENMAAYDYYSRARHEFYKYTREGNAMAVELLERALVEEPSFALAHAGLSLTQTQMISRGYSREEEWLDKAEESARRALEIDPELAEGYFALGFMFEQHEMYEEMEEVMRAVLALNPNHAHAHDGLADVLVRLYGRLDDALREYEVAQRLDPSLYPAAFNAAWALYYKGRYRESLRKINDALEIWPGSSLLRLTAGAVLQERREHRAAIEFYSAAIAIRPDYIRAFSRRAISFLALGETAACEQDARHLLELSNNSPYAKAEHNYVEGFIALAQGRIREAISRFEDSSAYPAFDYTIPARFASALGRAYLADGQALAAADVFDETLREYPFAKTLLYHKGTALEAAGDTTGALAAYREFKEAWKDADEDAPLLVDAQERLVRLGR